MTEFGSELLKVFGELNRPVSFIELSRTFNSGFLQQGIAELESLDYIKERPLMTYCITNLGRNHLRLEETKINANSTPPAKEKQQYAIVDKTVTILIKYWWAVIIPLIIAIIAIWIEHTYFK